MPIWPPRTPGLTRKSVKDVAERLRGFLRHLHRAGCTASDLSAQVIAPLLYAYEGIPSILTAAQIAAVLDAAGRDTSPTGLRDHAILQLLATYGLRSGEVVHLRLEDIDWRTDALQVRRSKSKTQSMLPLLAPAGDAVLRYLQHGRPETSERVVFVRAKGTLPGTDYQRHLWRGTARPGRRRGSSPRASAARTSSVTPGR